ncbi:rhotekin-2-like [Engraulis encrasicolus]|uniref:rhotekin-2-like n=1 Tax=Engraulis encrasicolus TaxID=184585 RepID=UPI002FD1C8D9
MRDAAYRLLQLCSQREHRLEAVKNIMTASARIQAHHTHRLRAQKQAACKGRVALSGLRIPLLWRDSDHFNHKGGARCVAVFCLMSMGRDVLDSAMIVVDRDTTDICLDGQYVFEGVESDFELRVELYSVAMEEAPPLSATPRKLANKLRASQGKANQHRASLGKAGSRKLLPLLNSEGQEEFQDNFHHTHPLPPGVSFSLLAFTSLGIEQAGRDFLSHSLTITQTAEASSWLPLYGSVCCLLLAQPDCMRLPTHTGPLTQQMCVSGVFRSCSLHCELQGAQLSGWFSPEEVEAKLAPFLTIPVTTATRVCVQRDPNGPGHILSIITPSDDITAPDSAHSSQVFRGDADDLQEWAVAFSRHTHHLRSWKHCCEELMEIEVLSPRKPLFYSKPPDSVYTDLNINSPCKFEGLTDIIHNKIEETGGRYLIGQEEEEEQETPDWSALFAGSRPPLLVQKVVLSPGKQPCHSTSTFSPVAPSNKRRSPVTPDNTKHSSVAPGYKRRSPDAHGDGKYSPVTPRNKKRSPITSGNNNKHSPVTPGYKTHSPVTPGYKKRKAPPPPAGKVPYTPPTSSASYATPTSPPVSYAPPVPPMSYAPPVPPAPKVGKENVCRGTWFHSENTRVPKASSVVAETTRVPKASSVHVDNIRVPKASSLIAENTRVPKASSRSGRPSLDTKFSSVIQQLQKKASTNRNAPHTNVSATASANGNSALSLQQPPVPAHRNRLRKSFRQIISSKPKSAY